MKDFKLETLRKDQLNDPSFNPEDYKTDQVFFKSKDGTKIPMFIVRKKSLLPTLESKPTQPLPTLLYGYGGFTVSQTPKFSPKNVILLQNMNSMYVVVNIRGGGEYGEQWHTDGKKQHKQNSYDDFIAAGEYLIKHGYTDSQHLTMMGGSNGGALVTGVANQRPDLFAGVMGSVPVTDMLRFDKFTIGSAWCQEYGCVSQEPEVIDFVLKVSPLHSVKKQKYPAMLVVTGDHDDRVVPSHSYKYIAELQNKAGHDVDGQRPLLLWVRKDAGHSGGGGTLKAMEETSETFGFMAKVTGVQWQD